MQKIKFKTNIKCSGCVTKVKDILNQNVGEGLWTVDLSDPGKTLTIQSKNENTEELETLIQNVGYKIEKQSLNNPINTD